MLYMNYIIIPNPDICSCLVPVYKWGEGDLEKLGNFPGVGQRRGSRARTWAHISAFRAPCSSSRSGAALSNPCQVKLGCLSFTFCCVLWEYHSSHWNANSVTCLTESKSTSNPAENSAGDEADFEVRRLGCFPSVCQMVPVTNTSLSVAGYPCHLLRSVKWSGSVVPIKIFSALQRLESVPSSQRLPSKKQTIYVKEYFLVWKTTL